jgi:hypothetical protein
MPIGNGDINFLYSGGTTNTDPNLSLGGDPSIHSILGTTLFQNVSVEESANGSVNYRCLYVSNDNGTETLYNAVVLISDEIPEGASVQLGYIFLDDRQFVNVSNFSSIIGGSFTLQYTDLTTHNIVVAYANPLSQWATNFQTAIRTITNLEEVTVSGSYNIASDNATFEINFTGTAGGRYHGILTQVSNNLTYSAAAPIISIVKSVNGSPINSVADSIDAQTTPPTSVVFTTADTIIGQLRPLDIVPVWIKRTVASGTPAQNQDGFTLRIYGTALP